jgi:hypothetical protein
LLPSPNPITVPSIIRAHIGAYTKDNYANELDNFHVSIGKTYYTVGYLFIGIFAPDTQCLRSWVQKLSIPDLLRIDSISW